MSPEEEELMRKYEGAMLAKLGFTLLMKVMTFLSIGLREPEDSYWVPVACAALAVAGLLSAANTQKARNEEINQLRHPKQ